MPKPMMHLAQFLVHGPTYHSLAMWRHPRTADSGLRLGAARALSAHRPGLRARRFDMVFFADLNYISDTFTRLDGAGAAQRHAGARARSHPAAVVHGSCHHPHRRSAPPTRSATSIPFHAARLWATLDHLTRGRAAWNVVTSLNHNQSANFGEELQADRRALRPRRTNSWRSAASCGTSWDEDAVVMDRGAGIFADPAKVHRIEHAGPFLQVARTAQRRALAAEWAGHPAGRHLGQGPRLRGALRRCRVRHPAQPRRRQGAVRRHQGRRRRGRPPRRRPARCCSACSRSSARRAPRRRTGRPNTTRWCRSRAASRSCRAISTSTSRPCRSTRSWPHRTEPQLQRHADALPHR